MELSYIETADIKLNITKAGFILGELLQCFKYHKYTIKRYVKDYELILFEKPGGHFYINGKRYDIRGRDIRLYKPGDYVYSYQFNDIYIIHFNIGDGEYCRNPEIDSIIPYMSAVNYEDIKTQMIALTQAYLNNDIIARNVSFWTLISKLKENQCLHENRKRTSSSQIVNKTKSYIENNYAKQIKLIDIGNALHHHPCYVHQVFSKETGMTPSDYLLSVRIRHAETLLLLENMSIATIAEKTGFCNTSYFIKQFKKINSISPGEYRKNIISNYNG